MAGRRAPQVEAPSDPPDWLRYPLLEDWLDPDYVPDPKKEWSRELGYVKANYRWSDAVEVWEKNTGRRLKGYGERRGYPYRLPSLSGVKRPRNWRAQLENAR